MNMRQTVHAFVPLLSFTTMLCPYRKRIKAWSALRINFTQPSTTTAPTDMANTGQLFVPDFYTPQPFELLTPEKYEIYTTSSCRRQVDTTKGETPCTPARARDLLTGRIVVPLTQDVKSPIQRSKYPQGTFAPIRFGIQGIDMKTLATGTIGAVVERGRLCGPRDLPFAQYFANVPGFTEVQHITVAVNVRYAFFIIC